MCIIAHNNKLKNVRRKSYIETRVENINATDFDCQKSDYIQYLCFLKHETIQLNRMLDKNLCSFAI